MLADADGTSNSLERIWLGGGGSAPGPIFASAGSIDGVKRGVLGSEAIGILPTYAVAQELTVGSLVELKVQEPLAAVALLLTTHGPPAEISPPHNLIELIGEALNV